MEIISCAAEMMVLGAKWRKEDKTVGLVPTMGFLHEGHLSLAKAARSANEILVMSIFVNPIQFGEGEDYEVYPRDLARDAKLAETVGVDYIFNPTPADMYGDDFQTTVKVAKLTEGLCGASRPVHFQGVTTVVNKLFNIVQPANAYFGQKDAQQVAVIEKMVQDLNMPVNIVRVPIVREADGLALSSRNIYLSAEERKQALVLSQSTVLAAKLFEAGERDADTIKKAVIEHIKTSALAEIEYVEIVNAKTIQPQTKLTGLAMLAMAVRFGKTRLIDNVILQ
ncbi:MAG: pantoate--beta-alanine ligase [Clostridia bacterium]|nr:pantoate--beta-alanine ligase [Clostridia bacterium]MDD4571182.1 pantoate--beta-alanine ligase [Clostridia bacterium]